MSQYVATGTKTFESGATIPAHSRVKLSAGVLALAGATDVALGTTLRPSIDGDQVPVRLRNDVGTVLMIAGAAITLGAEVNAIAGGKIDDNAVATYVKIGIALEAATADDDIVEILRHSCADTVPALGCLNLPLGAFAEQDGTTLADFSSAASPTPGWNAGDESFGIRWNNHANPDPISASIAIPPNLDATADVILHLVCAKTGATAGDTVNWTVEAFNQDVGALYDADADFGGECDAITGDAAAKTVQESTLTLALADIEANPCILTLTIQPKDGELATDDVILLGAWLEYTVA